MDKLKEYELGFELGPFKSTSKWVPDEQNKWLLGKCMLN